MVASARITTRKLLKPAAGSALACLCGLALWQFPFGQPFINASYDYLFRLDAGTITNNVALVLMDNAAFDHYKQVRAHPWDRALHAQLLNRLAEDRCAMVVFDTFFQERRDPSIDGELAEAMRRQHCVVLMAEQARVTHPSLVGAKPNPPTDPFLTAAGNNWGVAWVDPDVDSIVRRHWPFEGLGPYPSLPQTVARLAGAPLSGKPEQRYLRYYGREGAWPRMSYQFALSQPAGYFSDKIVFIGTQPKTSVADSEPDEFCTPYTRWTSETTGGVEIMITAALNLIRDDWLRRPAWWIEGMGLVLAGFVGGTLCLVRRRIALLVSIAAILAVTCGAILLGHVSHYWVPWTIVAAAQIPVAFAWALVANRSPRPTIVSPVPLTPEIPGYELFDPPFGLGAYGRVWLARSATDQWRAVKVVYREYFEGNAGPYDREFNGISRYNTVSDKHPGLLRVHFVSDKMPDYFYYIMDLGDSMVPGWEQDPSRYKPRDLGTERACHPGKRLPIGECVRVGLALSEALEFLHGCGLTHRDIKPPNVIFVEGQPRLADLGLISEIRPMELERTLVGTPGYMPPMPEAPGTPQADIYALGMLLYVISTGRPPAVFPELSASIVDPDSSGTPDFLALNSIILKACEPDLVLRYRTAAELHAALQKLQHRLVKPSRHPSSPGKNLAEPS
jgi:CHASE2 domain-containing sensor protein